MSPDRGGVGLVVDWKKAAQGDVLQILRLSYPDDLAQGSNVVETPFGVALISQTCDLVQERDRVVVAPVREINESEFSQVRRGAKPLWTALDHDSHLVADLEWMISVPRVALDSALVISHSVGERSGEAAERLSARIGRSLNRFAFPDAVHEHLGKLRRKISDGYSKNTSFASVLHLIDEFRVSCETWELPARDLEIYAIVSGEVFPPADVRRASWKWGPAGVAALKGAEQKDSISLERISELICENIKVYNDEALSVLWPLWMERFGATVIPEPSDEIATISMTIKSDLEFNFRDWNTSDVLDFSVLSTSSQK